MQERLQHENDHLDGILYIDKATANMGIRGIEMTEKLKVIYMGTPDFAVPPAFKRLIAGRLRCRGCVVTQPDKARDRGKKVQATPVKAAALEAGIKE